MNIDLFYSDLLGKNAEASMDVSNHFKVKLLCTSNSYGFAVVGFRNCIFFLKTHLFHSKIKIFNKNNLYFEDIKILSIAQFETQSSIDKAANKEIKYHKDFESIGQISYEPQCSVVFTELNRAETHLLVLTCKKVGNSASFEYFLNIYDLQTIDFNLSQIGATQVN